MLSLDELDVLYGIIGQELGNEPSTKYTIIDKSDEFKEIIDIIIKPEKYFKDWDKYINFVSEYDT